MVRVQETDGRLACFESHGEKEKSRESGERCTEPNPGTAIEAPHERMVTEVTKHVSRPP